ncbi:hypothetical protein IFM89_008684 [Coptis chinensis]|uniref:Uncharacterized protein n=1 Tax=Coptis chinensis TaxID=261450 RepID=A0A835GYL1_9MAGN|nr:hypothetical protein IFM89_008684 [Coptis chinensis]
MAYVAHISLTWETLQFVETCSRARKSYRYNHVASASSACVLLRAYDPFSIKGHRYALACNHIENRCTTVYSTKVATSLFRVHNMVITIRNYWKLKSYVREEDGVMILRLAGSLCILIFCLEWVVLSLAFALRYYAYVEGDESTNSSRKRSAKVQEEDIHNDWPWPFQV